MNDDTWSDRITSTVVGAIQARRVELGLSFQDLARLCTDYGYPTLRTTLANLEHGRRKTISLHEVFVIAKALKVAPIDLMAPIGVEVEALPDEPFSGTEARDWITGGSEASSAYEAGVRAVMDCASHLIARSG
ncbi:hypothetical protein GS897_20775 [Rhodococcus hoagii]|nr:hypothetical protein [Prescottella equi]